MHFFLLVRYSVFVFLLIELIVGLRDSRFVFLNIYAPFFLLLYL